MTQNDYERQVSRFCVVAQQFCELVDSSREMDSSEFLLEVYHILPKLIMEAMGLPDLKLDEEETHEQGTRRNQCQAQARISHEEWETLYRSLKEILGDHDLYMEVFDPTKDNEAIHGSLADDIADIYRDMKEGLTLKLIGKSQLEDAIRGWRLGFYSHWGKHAMEALRTIHFLLEDTLA